MTDSLQFLCFQPGVNVPWRRVGVSLSCHYPVGRVKCVSVALVVDRDEVHHQHVVLGRVHPVQTDLVRGEHASGEQE